MWVNNFLEKTKLPFLIIFEFMLLLRTISLYSLLPSKVDTLDIVIDGVPIRRGYFNGIKLVHLAFLLSRSSILPK